MYTVPRGSAEPGFTPGRGGLSDSLSSYSSKTSIRRGVELILWSTEDFRKYRAGRRKREVEAGGRYKKKKVSHSSCRNDLQGKKTPSRGARGHLLPFGSRLG